MNRNQLVGMVWVFLAVIYGVGGALVDERWWWLGGSIVFALVAVSTPLWSQMLPEDTRK